MLFDKYKQVNERIEAALRRSGRAPESVRLVAVTKYAAMDQVKELLETGSVSDIAENRVPAASVKKDALGELGRKVRWHMIGHLQRNKAKSALETFDTLDSLDSLKLAEVLEKQLASQDRRFPVLVQVKLSGAAVQSGIAPETVEDFLKGMEQFSHLDVRGVMGMAPEDGPVETVRPHFKRLKKIFDDNFSGKEDSELSMGMSRDFEVAVEEGATHVRIGSTIFSMDSSRAKDHKLDNSTTAGGAS